MKKIIVMLLALTLAFALAACSAGTDTSSGMFSADESFGEESSKANVSSEAEESSTVSDESSEVSEDEDKAPEFIANFVSIGTVDTKVKATSANAIQLTGVDVAPEKGAVVLYTPDYGAIGAEELSEFTVAEFTYSDTYFGYTLTRLSAPGEAEETTAPDDGFVIAAHASQTTIVSRIEGISSDETVFPHGLHLYKGADHTVKKTDKAITIDGEFTDEWSDYLVEKVDSKNPSWSYAQFEINNYYSTATYYTTYDDNYLYLCVVVDSPYHYCPITQDKAGDMYQYECIQVKVSSESPDGEYILENFDHVSNNKAATEGVVRSYGFAVNDDGETCYYEGGFTTNFTGLAACSRNDSTQLTVYEVAIPFAEYEITPESGMKLGLTFSINSTNEEDVANKIWKNITYRNGGGVIGRNDWSKIPVITLE